MAIQYKKGAGNWSAANGWNSQANGLGIDASHPLTAGDTADLNGLAVTLDVDVTVALIQASGAAGQLTVSGTRTINGAVAYAGTLTSGMIVVPTGTGLTVNGQVSNSSTGYAIVPAGTASITITNAGGTAISNTGTGRGLASSSTSGAITITGDVLVSAGIGILAASSSASNVLTGNVTVSGTAWLGIVVQAGTWNLDGNLGGTSTYVAFASACLRIDSGATVNWTGARSLAAATDCVISLEGTSTLNLATASAALTLTNSGRFVLRKFAGTLNITAAGGTAAINNQSHAAQACIMGIAVDIVNGPSVPSAADTRYGVTRGWADGGTGATAGCGVAGGNGTCYVPAAAVVISPNNVDATTGTYVAPVQAGYSALAAGYGAGGLTSGTLAASKIHDATYGTLADGSVLVAAGGTYVDPADADVKLGVAIGVSPRAGTYDYAAAIAAGHASGHSDQHTIDAAFLETNKAEIVTTDAAILAEFGVTGTAIEGGGGGVYMPTPRQIGM